MKDYSIIVREYKKSDARDLADIYYNTIHTINKKHYSKEQLDVWAPKDSKTDLTGWIKKWGKLKPLVAVCDDKIVGFTEFEANGHIDCFYVHHEWVGKGVGTILMNKINEIAATQEINRVFAEVSITAKPFFEAKGFKVITEQTVTLKGIDLTNYKMEKHISNNPKIKKIIVEKYNHEWPKKFEAEAKLLKEKLGEHCIEVHHIGSTSIPGLSAKEDLDILCIVDNLNNSRVLEEIGYVFKGEINIPLRYYFSKNTDYSKVNLHVCEKGHGFIKLNLCFRDYLRDNSDTLLEYGQLKEDLAADPKNHIKTDGKFTEYTFRKNDFIKSALKKAKFDGEIVNFCCHNQEWDEYNRIIKGKQQKNSPTVFNIYENQVGEYSFVLYKGIKIVAAALIKTSDSGGFIIESLKSDYANESFSHDDSLKVFIKNWCSHKNKKLIDEK